MMGSSFTAYIGSSYDTYSAGMFETLYFVTAGNMANNSSSIIEWYLKDDKLYYYIWDSDKMRMVKSIFWPIK